MSTPRTWLESAAKAASGRGERSAVLEPVGAGAAGRSDAELHAAIESAASRLLGLTLSRGIEERDPDEE